MSSSGPRRQVEALYLGASELEGEARARYLDAHCTDPSLRAEVEQLLAATRIAAQLRPGEVVGHYEIQSKLGQGGMGWVYQAVDRRLNRPVAIKVLPPGEIATEEARKRLAKEAEAASALNHPNIVTVYEIGRWGSIDFIAMERVGGKTLREIIQHRPMSARELVMIAIQIADALAAAHEMGIVHRDLKPGNVMVTERGLVKVLDFGLAKRMLAPVSGDADSAATVTVTTPGVIFGTYAYMSPEQAEGESVDHRADIFSFGCVMYEIATGKRAFDGENTIRTLAAVLGAEPRPLRELVAGLPRSLETVIEKCLRKKKLERWQHVGDVKILLEDVLKDLDSTAPAAGAKAARKWLERGAALTAGLVLATGLFWMLGGEKPAADGGDYVLRRLTTDAGLSTSPALSRDGALLAFASDRSKEGSLDIWIQQIGAREPVRLTRDPADETDPAISPDGTRIAFRSEKDGGGVYVIPALGGDPVLLAQGGRNPHFSPDGRWIAYWVGRESNGFLPGSSRVFIVDAGGGQPRQIQPSMAAALYPVWSPRGDALVALGRKDPSPAGTSTVDWWLLPVENGEPKRTGAFAAFQKQSLVPFGWQFALVPLEWWIDGGERLVFAASRGESSNLWEVALKDGEVRGRARQIMESPAHQIQASLASASETARMAFANVNWNFDVWRLPLDGARGVPRGDLQRVTEEESFEAAPSLSWDGRKLVFASRQSGKSALRLRDLTTGKESTLVAFLPQLENPKISGDGTSVAYSDRTGDLFMVPTAGGAVQKLCQKCGSMMGNSWDGKRISYEPLQSEDLTIFDVTQGKSIPLAPQSAKDVVLSGGQLSRDQQWVAFHTAASQSATARIWIARLDDKRPVSPGEWIAVTDGNVMERDPIWGPDDKLLYYLSERDGFRCVWARRLDAATRRPLGDAFGVAHFHTARQSLKRVGNRSDLIGLSVTGEQMMLAFGELTGNIWMREKIPVKKP